LNEPSTFGSRLRAARTEARLSQGELAQLVGSSKGYISELETNDSSRPSAELALKLAEAVGSTVEHLVRGAPKEQGQDLAFFRSYQALDETTKTKLNGILKLLKDD
jgi:putative transcriptional regulator